MNILRRFLCNVLGWHKPIWWVSKGFNTFSDCRYCGKEIMQDSQGNWFEVK